MNITIFGASGAIGKLLTSQALQQGDTVTAYVRKSGSLGQSHNNLHVVVGELTDQANIEKAIANADVVISTLGPALDTSRKLKGTLIADGHDLIIRVMKKQKKTRFITLATPSIKSKDDRTNISTALPGFMAKMLYPNAYREMKIIDSLSKIHL